ncbi:MAG TPA: hypothetical protein VK870_02135 [Ignavibacteriaceae bacterium]|nr:hypothetical protein [Ignavibacteriaceae bacterium]
MKKINNKIIDYLDGQMNSKQSEEFESELKNSVQLQKEFKEYEFLFNSVEFEKSRAIDKNYAESIIPAFRNRIEKNKPFRFSEKLVYPMYALSLAALILLILTLFSSTDESQQSDLLADNSERNDIELYIEQISADDLISSYRESQPEILDSVYKNHYSREIISSDNAVENLFAINGINYQELESILSDEEMDFVYNEIINIEFF